MHPYSGEIIGDINHDTNWNTNKAHGVAIVRPPFFQQQETLNASFSPSHGLKNVETEVVIAGSYQEGTILGLNIAAEGLETDVIDLLMYQGLAKIVDNLNTINAAIRENDINTIIEKLG